MRRTIPLALVLLIAAAGSAQAAFYAGASFQQVAAEFDTAVDNFDTDDSGWKVFGGFNIIKWLGVEASYRDLGTQEDSTSAGSASIELESYDISARGMLPLGMFTPFVKVGYANVAADGSFDLGTAIENVDEDDWEVLYGIGLDVNFGKHFGVRGEIETYDVEDSLDTYSVGAFFRF